VEVLRKRKNNKSYLTKKQVNPNVWWPRRLTLQLWVFNYDFSQFSCNLKITIELCQISQLICVRNHHWTLSKITTELWKITTELFQKSQLNWVKITTELCQKPQLNCEPSRPSYKCHNFVSFLWIFASLHVGLLMGLSGKPAGGWEI